MIRARNRRRWVPTLAAASACATMLIANLPIWQATGPDIVAPIVPRDPPPVPAAATAAAAAAAAAPAPPGAIIERPVFSPTRRPPVEKPAAPPPGASPPAAAAAPPPPEINFLLVGVVRSGSSRIAILQLPDGQPPQRLQEGQSLQGWTLIEIGIDRVSFRNAGVDRELALDFRHGPHGP